jgi:hypothetical protein
MKSSKALTAGAAATAVSLFALAASVTSANAYVVCNREGDCWHSEARVRAPGMTFSVHPDDWYFHQHWDADKDRHWRDYHEGRGYYRNGVWVQL